MAQPQPYNRTVDFTQRDGDDTDHAGINAEFDAVATSVNEVRDNLALIQKDDGSLANGIVTPDSLTPEVFEALTLDISEQVADASASAQSALNSALSAAASAATAVGSANAAATSENASALNASGANASAIAAAASQTAAAASAAAALASQNAAAASATGASTSAGTATTQAGIATTQAGIATTQAGNAATSATTATTQAGIATTQAGTATTQAGIATTQAGNAAASAAASAASALASAANAPLLLTGVTGTNTVTAGTTPATTAYLTGQLFKFIAANTNTGAVTVNVDAVGAAPITKNGTAALTAGDIQAGQAYLLLRDSLGNFQLSGGSGGGAQAGGVLYENNQTILADYTITTNKNAMAAGPITIATGVTLTIPTGSTLSIV